MEKFNFQDNASGVDHGSEEASKRLLANSSELFFKPIDSGNKDFSDVITNKMDQSGVGSSKFELKSLNDPTDDNSAKDPTNPAFDLKSIIKMPERDTASDIRPYEPAKDESKAADPDNKPQESDTLSFDSLKALERGMPLERATALTAVNNFLKDNFDKFDKNKDSLVTGAELTESLKGQNTDGYGEKVLGFLNDSLNTLGIEPDYWGSRYGFTRNTLQRNEQKIVNYNDYRARQKALVPDANELADFGLKNFDSIDTNGDNRVTRWELGKAINNAPDAESRHQLSEMQENYKYLVNGPMGFTLNNYRRFFKDYISRERLSEYAREQYSARYARENGFATGFKQAKADLGKWAMGASEQEARGYLMGEKRLGDAGWF